MKWFLILLAVSLTASEKLDRTYLPPPGAQFAGGNPGDILAPLETPHVPQTGLIPASSIPNQFNELEPAGQLPVTTTSYAFSQTTTFPSIESYETTAVPINFINPITGLPVQNLGHLNNLQYNQKLPDYSRDHDENAFGNNIQPSSLDPNQGEILIGGAFSKQPISNQPVSGPGFVKFPGSQFVNGNPNQHTIQTTESVAQVENNPLQGLSPISAQTNFTPKDQYSETGNQGVSPEYFSQDNSDRQMSLDIMQPYLYPDYQNQGTPILGNIGQQQSPHENQNMFNPGSILEKNYRQPGQAHDDVLSATSSFASSVSKMYPVSHVNRLPRPQAEGDRSAVILRYDNTRTPNGYSYSFETSNGIRADENGTVGDGTKAQGSYSYTGDDGKVYSVFYTADENGFQPHGDHLPTSPPIPEAIKKVIEQAARDEAAGIFDDGSYDENKYGYKKLEYPGSQRHMQRNKLERKRIRPVSDTNESQQLYESSDIGDTNMSSENYPSRKINENSGHEKTSNLKNSHDNGNFFPRPNEDNGLNLKEGVSLGHDADLDTYMSPVSGKYNGQQNIHDVRDRYPVKTGRVDGIMQSKPNYPGSTISGTEENIGNSNNGDGVGSFYGDSIRQDEQSRPGQASASPNSAYSDIYDRRQNEYQKPINHKEPGILNNKYINENTPQADQIFSQGNMKDFDSKRIDTPPLTNYSQNINNQQPINQEITSQLNDGGYYYNSPQNQFDHTEFPTRFKGKEVSSTMKPMYKTSSKSTTPRPFLTPEVHNQPSNGRQHTNYYPSTTPQLFMTPRVTTPKDDSYPDYGNDKDDIFDQDIDDKGGSTTIRPGLIIDSSTRRPNRPSQTSSIPAPSQPSRFSSSETPSKNTKSQQSKQVVNPPISNHKYQTARPVHDLDETVQPNYSSDVGKSSHASHIPAESKDSGPVPSGINTIQTTPGHQTRLDTSILSGVPGRSPTSSEYQNQPVRSEYNQRPQTPERLDFETFPDYYQNTNEKRPSDYSVTTKTPSKLNRPGVFVLSDPGLAAPESSPIGTYSHRFTTPDYADTILASTPSYFSPINSDFLRSQISQTLSPGQQYTPQKPLHSTTTSPSTIGTSPNFFIPSTQPSLLPEVYSTTQKLSTYSSIPDIYHQNHIVDGFGKPIISELRSVFPTPSQDATPNVGMFPGEKGFRKPEESSIRSLLTISDGERNLRPTYNIEQYPTNPEYNNQGKVLGEDFSGPKQAQRYDAQTGYHYK